MADLTAQRTLVKSPPELWSELSEVESLAKHLGELGEIRIVKVEHESTVAWEGEEVSGTVELEQSGWGTKVTFKATVPEPGPAAVAEAATAPEPVSEAREPEPSPEPVAVEPEPVEPDPEPESVAVAPTAEITQTEPPAEPKQGFLSRWLFRRRQPLPEPAAPPEPTPAPEPAAVESEPAPEPVEAPIVEPAPIAIEPEPPAEPEPAPVATTDAERVQRVLDGTLEALGQAHHRPFSRG